MEEEDITQAEWTRRYADCLARVSGEGTYVDSEAEKAWALRDAHDPTTPESQAEQDYYAVPDDSFLDLDDDTL